MRIPRGRKGFSWHLKQTATYDVGIAAFALVIGLTSASNYVSQRRLQAAWIVGIGSAAVFVFAVIKAGTALAAARKQVSMHELEGCLHTLHATLDSTAVETPGRLRLAVHVPTGDRLEQVTEYIGDRPKLGRVGRRFPANAGIIGKCYRENDVFVGRRLNDDYEAYVHELIHDWNYTEEQARRLNPADKEWMAVPFFDRDRGRVEAVLFIASTQRGFLVDERQELVLAAVVGIAIFIGKRYA